MSTGSTSRDDAEFEAFLGRKYPVSADYAGLEKAGPPASLDEKILAVAKVAAKPAPKPVVTPIAGKAVPSQPAPPAAAAVEGSAAERRERARPEAIARDDDDEALPARRPPWLLPAALAASVLVAVGVGLGVYLNAPSDSADATLDGALFAKRARERSAESKAAAAAGQDAAVIELEVAPLPPPPVFEPEGPQAQDAAIALIRKELVLANQVAAAQEFQALELRSLSSARTPGQQAAAPAPATETSPASASVVQPRERRLTKILELYDGGQPELAGDSLAIFLRDFEDDPISKRIVALTPN
ncbi:MAG: hypothetical protein EXR82_06320 [Gammaproteobacteria bacterium]|nr:hypothetical protein [Gammaproteobacteria bacterium]